MTSRKARKARKSSGSSWAKRFARRFSVLAVICAIGLAALMTAPGRVWLEGALRDLAWVERNIRLRLGMPLRGTPDLAAYKERLADKGLKEGSPVFMRIFKRESELELWMKKGERFILFASYPICRWSGRLGPKLKEGDRQSPEGFYTVAKSQLNPNSRWHRSFNLGYPNRLDRAHGRTGSYLMVHGGCGSIGCYAMTNPVIDEIWRLVTTALAGGQARFHVHVYPFRMTRLNMALFGRGKWEPFWRDLKQGHDVFEETRLPPGVSVCEGRYVVHKASAARAGMSALTSDCSRRLSSR